MISLFWLLWLTAIMPITQAADTPMSVSVYASQAENAMIESVPLTLDEQKFVKEMAAQYELSFELCLAVMKTESNFNCYANSGSSQGIMQLNSNTYPQLARDLGIDDFDPYNFQQNVRAGIYKLALERAYWIEQGFMDEEVVIAMLISYNRGRAGARRYIERYGLKSDYVDKVLEHKFRYEQDN